MDFQNAPFGKRKSKFDAIFKSKTAFCVQLSHSELQKINRFEKGINVKKSHDLEFIFRFNAIFHSKTAINAHY